MTVLTDAPVSTGLPVAFMSDLLVREPGAIRIGPFGSALKKDEYSESGIRVLGIDDVLTRGNPRKPKFIPEAKYGELTQYRVRAGDILVTNMGTVGRAFLVPAGFETAIISSHLIKVTPDVASVDAHYLEWALNAAPAVVAQIVRDSRGAIMAGFNTSRLKALAIPLPSLAEQQRIAGILDKAESLRTKRRTALARVHELKDAIYREQFEAASQRAEWPRCSLVELSSNLRYGTSEKSHDSGAPTLRIPNVIGGVLNLVDIKRVPLRAHELDRLRLQEGDLLFVRTNGNPDYVGRCAVFSLARIQSSTYCEEDFAFASYLIRVRLAGGKVVSDYIRDFMLSDEGRRALREISRTSAGQYNLNATNLGSVRVPVPPIALQRQYVQQIDGVRRAVDAMARSLLHVDALITSLQHRAFRGEL